MGPSYQLPATDQQNIVFEAFETTKLIECDGKSKPRTQNLDVCWLKQGITWFGPVFD